MLNLKEIKIIHYLKLNKIKINNIKKVLSILYIKNKKNNSSYWFCKNKNKQKLFFFYTLKWFFKKIIKFNNNVKKRSVKFFNILFLFLNKILFNINLFNKINIIIKNVTVQDFRKISTFKNLNINLILIENSSYLGKKKKKIKRKLIKKFNYYS